MTKFYSYHFNHQEILSQVKETGLFESEGGFGVLSLRQRQLDKGLSLAVLDGTCKRPVEFYSEESYPSDDLTLFINLGHCYECYMERTERRFLISPNQVVLCTAQHSSGYTRTACSKMCGINLNIELPLLIEMIQQDGRQEICELFRPLIERSNEPFLLMTCASGAVIKAARYLMTQSCDNPFELLKQKGLAWQVCAEVILSLINRNHTVASLRSADKNKIIQARELLLARCEQPPTLAQLAREVGLNDFKLKAGFKELFQQTPFSLLHEFRMEKARELLLNERGAIIQVANQVGYQNHGHFSSAFRKHFGLTPRDYLKLTA